MWLDGPVADVDGGDNEEFGSEDEEEEEEEKEEGTGWGEYSGASEEGMSSSCDDCSLCSISADGGRCPPCTIGSDGGCASDTVDMDEDDKGLTTLFRTAGLTLARFAKSMIVADCAGGFRWYLGNSSSS